MAFCANCGNDVGEARFCAKCGQPTGVVSGEGAAQRAPAAPPPAAAEPPSQPPADQPRKRNWFARHKILTGLSAMVVLIVIAAALSGGNGGTPEADLSAEAGRGEGADAPDGATLFPGRADAQPKDQERNIGEAATIDDVSATVTEGGFHQSIGDFQDDGYLVISVSLRNGGARSRPYSYFDWRVQTPAGQVMDADIFFGEGALDSADLIPGGEDSGRVSWEIKDAKGDFFVVWKPNPLDASRGIWKVTI